MTANVEYKPDVTVLEITRARGLNLRVEIDHYHMISDVVRVVEGVDKSEAGYQLLPHELRKLAAALLYAAESSRQ